MTIVSSNGLYRTPSSVIAHMSHTAVLFTLDTRGGCSHNSIKEKKRKKITKEAGVNVRPAMTRTWRSFTHPIPLIVTKETRFLNSI